MTFLMFLWLSWLNELDVTISIRLLEDCAGHDLGAHELLLGVGL